MNNVYIYILLMALITYLIRMLPLVVFKKPVKSRYFKSFLYYVPYVTLSVMTFPQILMATGNAVLGYIALFVSIILSYVGLSLPFTSLFCALIVYIAQNFV